jgi:hypothetical protein
MCGNGGTIVATSVVGSPEGVIDKGDVLPVVPGAGRVAEMIDLPLRSLNCAEFRGASSRRTMGEGFIKEQQRAFYLWQV